MKKLILTIAILVLAFAPTVLADSFSANHVQGIFGEFKPVLDGTVEFSANNVQGVFGQFVPVLDEAAGVVAPASKPGSGSTGTQIY